MAVSHQDMKFLLPLNSGRFSSCISFLSRFRSASSSPCLEFKQFSSHSNKWETALVSYTITVQTRILILIRHEVGFLWKDCNRKKEKVKRRKKGSKQSLVGDKTNVMRKDFTSCCSVHWRGCRCWGVVWNGSACLLCQFLHHSLVKRDLWSSNARFRRTSPFPPIVSIRETGNRLK